MKSALDGLKKILTCNSYRKRKINPDPATLYYSLFYRYKEKMDKKLEQFANQNYLNLESFRKNGVGVKTPVWFVQDGGTLYVRTIRTAGKMKRVRNNGLVNIMPCGQSGEPLGEWVSAVAREVSSAETFALLRRLLVAKYGDMVAMFEARTKADGLEYTAIQIEIGE
jgi:PPOX class probable F420-dependent enzyme